MVGPIRPSIASRSNTNVGAGAAPALPVATLSCLTSYPSGGGIGAKVASLVVKTTA